MLARATIAATLIILKAPTRSARRPAVTEHSAEEAKNPATATPMSVASRWRLWRSCTPSAPVRNTGRTPTVAAAMASPMEEWVLGCAGGELTRKPGYPAAPSVLAAQLLVISAHRCASEPEAWEPHRSGHSVRFSRCGRPRPRCVARHSTYLDQCGGVSLLEPLRCKLDAVWRTAISIGLPSASFTFAIEVSWLRTRVDTLRLFANGLTQCRPVRGSSRDISWTAERRGLLLALEDRSRALGRSGSKLCSHIDGPPSWCKAYERIIYSDIRVRCRAWSQLGGA
jgi:hypothetical protein